MANLDLWSLIEPCSSTICISLPCLGPLFRGGHSPSSLVNSVRAVFTLESDSSSQSHMNRGQPSAKRDSIAMDTLRAAKQLSHNDDHLVDSTDRAKTDEISDLEGSGVRVVSNG